MVGEVRFHPQPGEEFEEIGASLVGIVAEPNERLDVRLDDIVHAKGLAAGFKGVLTKQVQSGLVDRDKPPL